MPFCVVITGTLLKYRREGTREFIILNKGPMEPIRSTPTEPICSTGNAFRILVRFRSQVARIAKQRPNINETYCIRHYVVYRDMRLGGACACAGQRAPQSTCACACGWCGRGSCEKATWLFGRSVLARTTKDEPEPKQGRGGRDSAPVRDRERYKAQGARVRSGRLLSDGADEAVVKKRRGSLDAVGRQGLQRTSQWVSKAEAVRTFSREDAKARRLGPS